MLLQKCWLDTIIYDMLTLTVPLSGTKLQFLKSVFLRLPILLILVQVCARKKYKVSKAGDKLTAFCKAFYLPRGTKQWPLCRENLHIMQ